MHFCAVLLVSAILSAPWARSWPRRVGAHPASASPVAHLRLIVARRARPARLRPVFEDWLWHVMLPFVVLRGLTVGGPDARANAVTGALFVVAAATLLLLFIGIHNAWDTVTYLVLAGD